MTQQLAFRTILLETDGSDDAQQAAVYARDLALQSGATVHVVHVVPDVPTIVGEPERSETVERNMGAGQRTVLPVVAELRDCGVRVEAEILDGEPGEAVLRAAASRQPDLVILGRSGCEAPRSLLLGSASHRVLTEAEVPVLVVNSLNGRSG